MLINTTLVETFKNKTMETSQEILKAFKSDIQKEIAVEMLESPSVLWTKIRECRDDVNGCKLLIVPFRTPRMGKYTMQFEMIASKTVLNEDCRNRQEIALAYFNNKKTK